MTDNRNDARDAVARDYRERETAMLEAAASCELPSVRGKFLDAAHRWRQLADLAGAPSALRWAAAPPLL